MSNHNSDSGPDNLLSDRVKALSKALNIPHGRISAGYIMVPSQTNPLNVEVSIRIRERENNRHARFIHSHGVNVDDAFMKAVYDYLRLELSERSLLDG